jgi:5-hydroxyisourate hydrolase-like protein (transthyretin family)
MKSKILSILSFLIIVSCAAKANTSNGENLKKKEIAGSVINQTSKKPVANVTVTAYLSNRKEKVATSDANGNYSFDELKPGVYKFTFEKNGYKKQTKEKTIRAEEEVELNIYLEEHTSFDFMPGPGHFIDFE